MIKTKNQTNGKKKKNGSPTPTHHEIGQSILNKVFFSDIWQNERNFVTQKKR